jgi:N-formylmaleamate deformylase
MTQESPQYGPGAEAIATVKGYRKIEELIPPHWSEATVVANGIKQHYYRTGGEKPPMVLLHGILAGGLYWLRVAKALEQDYDVIMLDARGHGRSERIGNAISYSLITEDTVALIQALKLDKPILLGHSMGGGVAAMVAAAYPELVRSILLEDSVWGAATETPQFVESEAYRAWMNTYMAYLEALKIQTHEERLLAGLNYLPPGSGVWPEEEYVPWMETQAQLDLEMVKLGPALWGMMKLDIPLSQLVQRIGCPILLMTGGRGLSTPELVKEVMANCRDCQHVLFEDASHLIHLDQFDRYIEVVKAFLE